MNNIRFVKSVSAMLAILSLLTACGTSAASDAETPPTQQEQSAPSQTEAVPMIVPAPQNMIPYFPLAMDYLGMGVIFDKEVTAMGLENSLFLLVEQSISQNREIEKVMLCFNLVPEESQDNIPQLMEEFEQWYPTTQRAGVLGVYSPAYLEEHPLDELTGCTQHTQLGTSPDGSLVYYMSTNTAEGSNIDQLLAKTNVQFWEPTPLPKDDFFDLLGQARSTATYIGDFQAETLSHGVVTPKIFSDYDLTLVNVFATWCSPCIQEIPGLAEIDKEMAEQSVNVIGIVMDVNAKGQVDEKKKELALTIAEKTGAEYEILLPDEVLLEGRLRGIDAYPETFFVDREGNIVGEYYVGGRSKEDWVQVIQTELENLKK